jgi:tRNA threonylcarbamoyl adenosine modification protein YjeE
LKTMMARIKESSGMPKKIHSHSSEETHRIGIEIGKNLQIPGVVLLRGTLGMGKTTLARGIAEGLGLADTSRVCSPSFTLVNIYQGRCPIYHVDLYRLSGAARNTRSARAFCVMQAVGVMVGVRTRRRRCGHLGD